MSSPRTHLLRVLRGALATAPTWWTPPELELVARAASLDEATGDSLARLLQRTRPVVRRRDLDLADAALGTLEAFGWLARITPDDDPPAVLATIGLDDLGLPGPRPAAERTILGDVALITGLSRFGPFYTVPPRARQLVALACLAAFAGDDDPSLLTRIAIGQLAPPVGSPLAATLTGERTQLGPLPWASRAAAETYLIARDARARRSELPPRTIFTRALAEVQASAGQPLHLGWHHLSATHHWTRLLAECLSDETTHLTATDRQQALRALRRAPCSPALTRDTWENVHAAWSPRPTADRLAQEFATWPLWGEVERAAWAARASGTRVRRARVWNLRTVDAWLDHDGARIVADGELVEALALRRLAAEGWQGLHAEGGFWLAAAHLLLDHAPAGPVAWCAPLQTTPLDWGRWGYGARRAKDLRAAASLLIRDREAALAIAVQRAGTPLPGFLSPPSISALTAVVRHLPLRVLVPLLLRVLDAPHEAGGLPDLVVWKDQTVAFWEVKSPADQLSAKQRRWLTWLVSEGVPAGVLRVAARKPVQTSLFTSTKADATTARARPQRPRVAVADGFTLLAGGHAWRAERGDVVPPTITGDDRTWHVAVRAWRDVRSELPFVDDVLVPLPIAAVLVETRDGRRTTMRRWFPVPTGLVVVGALREEALPGGGMGPCLRVLTRSAGWLIPAGLSATEPVVAKPDELADPTRDWVPHPPHDPPRAESVAQAWGCNDELADQLLMIGAEPHGIWIEHTRLVIATDPRRPVLWTARDPRLAQGLLPIR